MRPGRLARWLCRQPAGAGWRRVAVIALAGATAFACSAADRGQAGVPQPRAGSAPAATSTQQRAWEAIAKGALLIDVRSEGEYAQEHLPGAVNIPVDALSGRLQEVGQDTARAIVVYCRSGARSAAAAGALRRSGYTRVIDGGGLSQMRAAQPPPR